MSFEITEKPDRKKATNTSTKRDKVNVPKYSKNQSFTQYVTKVEKFKLQFLKDKYQLLLDFLNDWLKYDEECKLKSLTEFKNIQKSDLLNDNNHNQKIIRDYNVKIEQFFNIKYKADNKQDIIYLVTRMLTSINYKFIFKDLDDDVLVTIIQK